MSKSAHFALNTVHQWEKREFAVASDSWPEIPLWINAVRINQDDEAELHCQIRLMGRIYRQALRVYIYIDDYACTCQPDIDGSMQSHYSYHEQVCQ